MIHEKSRFWNTAKQENMRVRLTNPGLGLEDIERDFTGTKILFYRKSFNFIDKVHLGT